jgi:hypothetical protein
MKKAYSFGVIIIFLALPLNSCKLDSPVYPGDPGYMQSAPPDSLAMNGNWIVQSTTVTQSFGGQSSTQVTANYFKSVLLNTMAKTGEFTSELITIPDYTYGYTTAASGSNFTITFAVDVFARNANSPIIVTKRTSKAMVWVAADAPVDVAGYTYQVQYQVTFSKTN